MVHAGITGDAGVARARGQATAEIHVIGVVRIERQDVDPGLHELGQSAPKLLPARSAVCRPEHLALGAAGIRPVGHAASRRAEVKAARLSGVDGELHHEVPTLLGDLCPRLAVVRAAVEAGAGAAGSRIDDPRPCRVGLDHVDVNVEVAAVVPGAAAIGRDADAADLDGRVDASLLVRVGREVPDVHLFVRRGVEPLAGAGTARELPHGAPPGRFRPGVHAHRRRVGLGPHQQSPPSRAQRADPVGLLRCFDRLPLLEVLAAEEALAPRPNVHVPVGTGDDRVGFHVRHHGPGLTPPTPCGVEGQHDETMLGTDQQSQLASHAVAPITAGIAQLRALRPLAP